MDEGRKYKTQTEWVVQSLREAILRGEIQPGEKLRQEEIAQQLGTSPTPVREAFRQLEAEGLVVHLPHRGVKVAEFSIKDAEEVYWIRSTLEGLAARLAVERSQPADLQKLTEKLENVQRGMQDHLEEEDYEALTDLHDDFHMRLYEAANSQRLLQLIIPLRALFPRDTFWVIPGRAGRSMEEHRAILEALRARDAELTGRLVSQHIEAAMRSLLDYLKQAEPIASLSKEVMTGDP